MGGKRHKIVNSLLKKNNVRRMILPMFEIYYKVAFIKTVMWIL